MAPAVVRVADPDDPQLAGYRDLPDRARRREGRTFVVESRLVLRELVAGGRFPVLSLLCTDSVRESLGEDVLAAVPRLFLAPDALVRRVVGYPFHGGCVAIADRGAPGSLDALLAGLPAGPCCVVVLDCVSNPDNVGGAFRNARAFGAGAVVLGPGSGDPLSRKAIRAAMGASLVLPFVAVADWPGALAAFRAAGLTLVALTPRQSACDVGAVDPPARLALLVGAEGPGLGDVALAAADVAVRIPMAAGVDSLNVAAATAIALHRLRPR